MNKILSTLIIALAFFGMDVGALAQTLSIGTTSVRVGENTALVVKAEGLSEDISALQFNLALPKGTTLDESAITKGEAASGHTLEVRPLSNGNRLFVLYNLDMATIKNGELLRLPITMYAAAGSYNGSLSTVRTATTNSVSSTLSDTNVAINAFFNEGEFTAKTKEDVTMIFKVLDEEAKTCQVGNGDYASVDVTTAGTVTIPEVANGYKVVAIGDKGFYNCSKLKCIWMHEGIESIGDLAFYGCTILETLDIPKSVKHISNSSFRNCPAIVKMPSVVSSRLKEMPEGNITITPTPSPSPTEQEELTQLKRIYITKAITTLGERSWSYCSSVIKIEVDSENTVFDSREDCNAIIKTEDNILLYGCQNTKIPETVTAIAPYAFEGHSNLKKIDIPGSMISIGKSAFSFCTNLKEVYCRAENVPETDIDAFKGYAEDVPETDETFIDTDISNATLYVPLASIEAYRTTAPWSGFGNIVGLFNYYDYSRTLKTLDDKAEWAGVLNSVPNAVAVVGADQEDWAASQKNVIVEKDDEHYCPNFVLTDLTETTGSDYEQTGFYSPCDFTAKNGTYKRQAYAGCNTVCVPFSFTASDLSETAETYAFVRYDDIGSKAIFKKVTGTIAAGTPCIVKEPRNVVWNVSLTNKKISTSTSSQNDYMMGTFVTTDAYQGKGYSPNSDNEFAPLSKYLHPFRACLILGGESGARGIRLVLENDVTDIDNVEVNTATLKNGKYLEKGKLVIYKNGRKYNANGSTIK